MCSVCVSVTEGNSGDGCSLESTSGREVYFEE